MDHINKLFKTLSLLIHEHGYPYIYLCFNFFHKWFTVFRVHVFHCLKFISKYFILFHATGNGIAYLISFFLFPLYITINFIFFSAFALLFIFFNFILFLNLKHCISFAKHQNESATGIHTLPILNPPPSSLPTPSLSSLLMNRYCLFKNKPIIVFLKKRNALLIILILEALMGTFLQGSS